MAIIVGKISIPKSAYSIYDIAKNEQIPKEKIEQMMQETLKKAIECSPVKTNDGIEKFFNNIGCNDSYINSFGFHSALQPFSSAIRLTIEKNIGQGENKCFYAAFYVFKTAYENWKKRGIKYEPNQTNIGTCDVAARANKTTFVVPTNYVVAHFKKTVKSLNMNISDVVLTALDFFMKQHSDIFGEYGAEIKENLVRGNKTAFACGYINRELNNKIWKALQRYNQVNTPPIKYGDFLESALAEKLERMPVKYTNPELFEEYKRLLKEAKEKERELEGSE